jgi:hypothetical protein
MDSSILPSQEEKKHMIEQPTPIQIELSNWTRRNRNSRENRCIHLLKSSMRKQTNKIKTQT